MLLKDFGRINLKDLFYGVILMSHDVCISSKLTVDTIDIQIEPNPSYNAIFVTRPARFDVNQKVR